ncbi:MAG: YraN family protein [Betaproteobacteria bacterium]|jgi:putative endonuclease|nr:YraN family protein [Betaproteobacteria bacterium]
MSVSGSDAEMQAAGYLMRQGLKILKRNYRCRGGEIDLVCQDGATLVFVEVRLRTSLKYGGAAASITPAKQRRIVLAASHYLAGKPLPACRFDAVLLDGENIDWIRNAFDAA